MPLHLVTYGIDKTTGAPRYIEDVPSGLACNCVCPKCGFALEAHKGEVQRHHFQHHSVAECKGAFESQLHLLSKAIIEEQKTLALPPYLGRYCFYPQQQQTFTEVVKECAQGDLQPDCLCKYRDEQGNEQTLWVEILYSHAVDEEKAKKIRERKIACVEIDVSQLFKDADVVDKDTLTVFLLNSPDNRHWINNPRINEADEQGQAAADEIRKLGRVADFLKQNSDDEARIWLFQSVTYCLFSTGYRLSQADYNSMFLFVKERQSDYGSLASIMQRRYVSAVQMLLCHLVVTKLRNSNQKVKFVTDFSFNRNGIIQQLSQWVNEVVSMGAAQYRQQRTMTVRRSRYRGGRRF